MPQRVITVNGLRLRRKLKTPHKRTFAKKEVHYGDYGPMNDLFLGMSDMSDYVTGKIMTKRVQDGKSTFNDHVQMHCSKNEWNSFVAAYFVSNADCKVFDYSHSYSVIICGDNFVSTAFGTKSVSTTVFGDRGFVDKTIKDFVDTFKIVTSSIEWIYSNDGQSISVPLNTDKLPVDEMYPFLNDESLQDYYSRYMKSSASILLMIGPPGTGKTSFVRGLLHSQNSSAMVTYDPAVLERDGIFANFIESDTEIMIMEDADNFLGSRSNGNTMMHRFLNVSDGLVTTSGKKLVFTTNLPNLRDVDTALTRSGRCFDILKFDLLNEEQATKLAKKLDVEIESGKSEYTIADIFHKQDHQFTKKPMGFI